MSSYSAYRIQQLEKTISTFERVITESQEAQVRDRQIATARGFLLWRAEKRIAELEAVVSKIKDETYEAAAQLAERIAHEQSVVAEEKAEDTPAASDMHELESMLAWRVAALLRKEKGKR